MANLLRGFTEQPKIAYELIIINIAKKSPLNRFKDNLNFYFCRAN